MQITKPWLSVSRYATFGGLPASPKQKPINQILYSKPTELEYPKSHWFIIISWLSPSLKKVPSLGKKGEVNFRAAAVIYIPIKTLLVSARCHSLAPAWITWLDLDGMSASRARRNAFLAAYAVPHISIPLRHQVCADEPDARCGVNFPWVHHNIMNEMHWESQWAVVWIHVLDYNSKPCWTLLLNRTGGNMWNIGCHGIVLLSVLSKPSRHLSFANHSCVERAPWSCISQTIWASNSGPTDKQKDNEIWPASRDA